MRRMLAAGVLLVPLVAGVSAPVAGAATPQPTRLIIDTDFGQWWDDAAALAAAHAAADQGRASILGVISSVDNPWNAPALDAVNTWYGRPDIPIGNPTGAMPVEQNYSRYIAENFPHAGSAEDAIGLYRRLLAAQPDHSVTILSVGALTNLAQLAAADRALLARKVAVTVIMGGEYPRSSAPEWNFGLDLDATRQVVAGWPTPVVYDGFEIGARIIVGNGVCAAHPSASPIRAAFDILYGCGNRQTDGTWDPTAVYYAIYGTAKVYGLAGRGGRNVVYPDGNNAWAPRGHHQQYLTLTDPVRLTTSLDALINAQPS